MSKVLYQIRVTATARVHGVVESSLLLSALTDAITAAVEDVDKRGCEVEVTRSHDRADGKVVA